MMTHKLTKEQALAITGFTGICACGFELFHEDAEKRLGRPIFTHEFAIDSMWVTMRDLYREDFLAICFEGEE